MKEDRLVPAGGKDQEQTLPWQSDRARDEALALVQPLPARLWSRSPAAPQQVTRGRAPAASPAPRRAVEPAQAAFPRGRRRLGVGNAALLTPSAEKHPQTKGALRARAGGGAAGSQRLRSTENTWLCPSLSKIPRTCRDPGSPGISSRGSAPRPADNAGAARGGLWVR